MSDEKVKILFLTVNNPGVIFYRMYQFAQRMSELGLAHCRMYPQWNPVGVFTQDWESKLKDHLPTIEPMVAWADFVVLQYIHSDWGLTITEAIRDLKPLFMEVDDYISSVPYYSAAYDDNQPGGRQDLWATRQAFESHGVVTTTEYLKNYFSNYNENVHVIPNCIDFNLWDQYNPIPHDKIRIGWIGGMNHDGDLRIVKDALYEILDKYENVEVNIYSPGPPAWEKMDRLNLITGGVPIDLYPKTMKEQSFDIGLAPLRDNNFNRGKSNLRYLEYSACKIPTVASDVEPFRHDFTGLLASTDEDWVKHLSYLIENWELRLEMGMEAYRNAKEKFSLDVGAKKYAEMVREQLAEKPKALEIMAFEEVSMDAKPV